jgi:hypothetical protein
MTINEIIANKDLHFKESYILLSTKYFPDSMWIMMSICGRNRDRYKFRLRTEGAMTFTLSLTKKDKNRDEYIILPPLPPATLGIALLDKSSVFRISMQ